ncbi:MAG: hypothetical protein AAF664_21155 [Planctomycetota bacterium]
MSVCVAALSRTRYVTPDISRRVYQGMSLEFQVDTGIDTYLMMAPIPLKMPWLVGWLQRLNGANIVFNLPEIYQSWKIWAKQVDWVASKFTNPHTQDHFKLLVSCSPPRTPITIYWKQRKCGLIVSGIPGELSGVAGWRQIEALCQLVDSFERA